MTCPSGAMGRGVTHLRKRDDLLFKRVLNFLHSRVTESWAIEGGEIENPATAFVETGVDFEKFGGGFGVELHRVAFDSADGAGVGREEDVGDLSEAGVC